VTKELDILATALYVKIDDLLRADPGLAPWRPRTGIAPRLADAEVVTLAVLRALLGFTSEARFLRHARVAMCGLFPYLPRQPGCNKRLRALAGTISVLARALARDTSIWADDVWAADATPVECGRSWRPSWTTRPWPAGPGRSSWRARTTTAPRSGVTWPPRASR